MQQFFQLLSLLLQQTHNINFTHTTCSVEWFTQNSEVTTFHLEVRKWNAFTYPKRWTEPHIYKLWTLTFPVFKL